MCEAKDNHSINLIKLDLINAFKNIGLTKGCKGPIANVMSEVNTANIGDVMIEFFMKN